MPPTPDRLRPASHTWIASTVLVVGTLLLFTRSLDYGFINYDDPAYVTANPRVQAGLTWEGVVWAFTGDSDYWRPLAWISHMIDWQLFGERAAGHRFVNLLWHAANAVLAFILMCRLTGAWWASLIGSALFAWHPLRVESVVWVTERKDVMSGFFFFFALWAHARFAARHQAGQPARGAYGLTLALFLGGLMCKPSVVTLPLVLLAMDFWPLGRLSLRPFAGWWNIHRGVLLEKIPFLVLATAVSYATVHMQAAKNAFVLAVPLADRIGNALVSVVRYLGHILWPADLAIFYEHPGMWPGGTVAGALTLVLLLTVFAWWQRNRLPSMLTGWAWFLVMLLPALGLFQVGLQAMADRFTYLPILGLHLAALGMLRFRPVSVGLQAGVAGLALTACVGLTWHQQQFWRDSETLYQRAIAVDPTSSHAEAFLGYTYEEAGSMEAAERHARRALELSPVNHWGWLTLANVQERTGRFNDALESYRRLTDINPGYLRGFYRSGRLLQELGRLGEAEISLSRAAELAPSTGEIFAALAEVQARQRKFAEAAGTYLRLVALRPDDAEAHAGLGYMLALTNRRAEAVRHWEVALRLKPDFPGLRERLQRMRP